MKRILTFDEWASNPSLRKDLQDALEHPAIQSVIATLKEANAPDVAFKVDHRKVGCSIMEALALDAERRGGVHQALKTLELIPHLQPSQWNEMKKKLEAIGEPYDYIKEIPRNIQPTE